MNGTTSGTGLFECTVCLGRITAPKVLPCGHSLCETCLEPLVQTESGQRLVKCPECREVAHMPENGFPKNYKLEEALSHLRGGGPTKTCRGCEKDFGGVEIMRCLTCEKDFCEREVTICGICALRNHKQHDVLDLPKWPKDCFKVIGRGQISLIVTSMSELSQTNPKQGDDVEISGALWHLEAQLDEDGEAIDMDVICTSTDGRRYWADVEVDLNVSDAEWVKCRKILFGDGLKVPPTDLCASKTLCQEKLDEGPVTMTARLTVYEDMFVHSNEHSDLKLIVEGQDIHVKKGILSAASAPLASLLDTVSGAELSVPDCVAFELLSFLIAIYPVQRSTLDFYTSAHRMLAVHKLAKVYDVKRLFDDIDTYLKVDWGLAVTDASIRLWVAQHLQRDHVLDLLVECMTSDDIETACFLAKVKRCDYNATTLLKLLEKHIELKADDSDSSSTDS